MGFVMGYVLFAGDGTMREEGGAGDYFFGCLAADGARC